MSWSYLDSSNTWVLWCSDRGLMLYCRTWQVLGWILGVMYACNVPYCPSIDLIWNKHNADADTSLQNTINCDYCLLHVHLIAWVNRHLSSQARFVSPLKRCPLRFVQKIFCTDDLADLVVVGFELFYMKFRDTTQISIK